jgi:hypothetical protein
MLKNFIYLLLLSLAGLGYWKRAELGDYWERIQLASSELITPPSKNTAPNDQIPKDIASMAVTTEAAKPKQEQLITIPQGYFYTTERVSSVFSGGVKAIAAGTRVRKVGETPDGIMIDDGSVQMLVDSSKLTSDPHKVGALRKAMPTPPPISNTPNANTKSSETDYAMRAAGREQCQTEIAGLENQIGIAKEKLNKELALDNGSYAAGHFSIHTATIASLKSDILKFENQKGGLVDRLKTLIP